MRDFFFGCDIAAVFILMKQQKIELLAGTLGKPEDDAPSTNNSITAVNLLKGVEKSYGADHFLKDT